ncbi:MAG: hypothetical protein ABR915_00865 [Thermoguttaceae bacterium]
MSVFSSSWRCSLAATAMWALLGPNPGTASAEEQPRQKEGKRAVTVTRLPGGGVQIIIAEGGEGQAGEAVKVQRGQAIQAAKTREAAEKARSQAEVREHGGFALFGAGINATVQAVPPLGGRIKREKELAAQALMVFEKMEAAKRAGKEGVAHELWEQLDAIQREVRKVCQPVPPTGIPPLGDRLKRQYRLAAEAQDLFAKWQSAQQQEGNEAVARELWEKLDAVQRELRQVCQPAPYSSSGERPVIGQTVPAPAPFSCPLQAVAPVAPASAAPQRGYWNRESMVHAMREMNEKAARLAAEGKKEQSEALKHEVRELQESLERLPQRPPQPRTKHLNMPNAGQPADPFAASPADPGIQQLRSEVQDLRNQVREIKELLRAKWPSGT